MRWWRNVTSTIRKLIMKSGEGLHQDQDPDSRMQANGNEESIQLPQERAASIRAPLESHDVIAAVDECDFAGDAAGEIGCKEQGSGADL